MICFRPQCNMTMQQKKRPLPGADRIDDLVKAVEGGWKHEVDGIDVQAVGLFTRIFVLARLESVFYEHALAETERNSTEHYVLAMIRALGPRSPTELNVALIQTSGGVTNTLTRLEKAGLITRERVGSDRRTVEVRLTPAGRKEADRTMAIVGKAMHGKATVLPKRKREESNRALDELIAALLN
jgi:DNA-binding MarR family transcriptional regulator